MSACLTCWGHCTQYFWFGRYHGKKKTQKLSYGIRQCIHWPFASCVMWSCDAKWWNEWRLVTSRLDTLIILSGSQTAFFYKCIQFLFRDARNKVKFIFPSYNVTVSNDNLLNKKKNKHARTFTGKRSDLS